MSNSELTPKDSLPKVDAQQAPTKQGIVRVKFYLK